MKLWEIKKARKWDPLKLQNIISIVRPIDLVIKLMKFKLEQTFSESWPVIV